MLEAGWFCISQYSTDYFFFIKETIFRTLQAYIMWLLELINKMKH